MPCLPTLYPLVTAVASLQIKHMGFGPTLLNRYSSVHSSLNCQFSLSTFGPFSTKTDDILALETFFFSSRNFSATAVDDGCRGAHGERAGLWVGRRGGTKQIKRFPVGGC